MKRKLEEILVALESENAQNLSKLQGIFRELAIYCQNKTGESSGDFSHPISAQDLLNRARKSISSFASDT